MDFHSPQSLLILFYKKMEFSIQEKCIKSMHSILDNSSQLKYNFGLCNLNLILLESIYFQWYFNPFLFYKIISVLRSFLDQPLKPCFLRFNRFLGLPHPGLAMYQTCIQLESNLATAGDKDGLANARKLFESALTTYGQNVSLWQEYYTLESKVTLQFPYNLEMFKPFYGIMLF